MQQQDERTLLNNSSAAALYDRYGAIIFAYIRLHTISREDAEDLTVEVFTAALERNNLTELPEREQLTWLRRVARNKLVDTYRHGNRHPSVTLEKVAETLYDDERRSPEGTALLQEEYQQLYTAIRTLSNLEQHVLQLRYGHGLRFAEIALLLNKREEAVRKMLSRTLSTLRTLYTQRQEGKK